MTGLFSSLLFIVSFDPKLRKCKINETNLKK